MTGRPTIVTIPILPLRGTVVFPHTVVPLAAAQARSLRLIDDVMSGDRVVGLCCRTIPRWKAPGPTDVRTIGTAGSILQMMRVPDGSVRLAVQGSERMRILEWVSEEPFLIAKVEKIPGDGRGLGRGRGADAQHAGTFPATGLARLAPAGRAGDRGAECRRSEPSRLSGRDQPPHGGGRAAAAARRGQRSREADRA